MTIHIGEMNTRVGMSNPDGMSMSSFSRSNCPVESNSDGGMPIIT